MDKELKELREQVKALRHLVLTQYFILDLLLDYFPKEQVEGVRLTLKSLREALKVLLKYHFQEYEEMKKTYQKQALELPPDIAVLFGKGLQATDLWKELLRETGLLDEEAEDT